MTKTKGYVTLTPPFRVSYPHVFKPKYNDLAERDEYEVTALFKPGEDLTELKKLVRQAVIDQWGPDKAKWPENMKSPFKDQGTARKKNPDGTKTIPDGYTKGAVMVRLKSTVQPGLVDSKRQPILDETQFYAGCYARAQVYIRAYDIKNGLSTGVSISLNHIQKVADGEPFSGRRKAEEVFSAIEDDNGDASGSDDPFGADESSPF